MIQYENEYAWKCAPPWQKRHDIEGEFRIIVSEVSFFGRYYDVVAFFEIILESDFLPPSYVGTRLLFYISYI